MKHRYALVNCEDAVKWTGQEKLFSAAFGGEWTVFNAYEGQLPPTSTLSAFTAAFVTGSHHAAYDPLDWISSLAEWIQEAVTLQTTKLVSICFGCQISAKALGGEAGQNPSGRFVLTVEEIRALPALTGQTYYQAALRGYHDPSRGAEILESGTFRLIETHGDQVTKLPPGATLLATSATAPFEMWSVGSTLLAMQGHPEMPCSSALELILPDLSANGRLSPEEASAGETALRGLPPDSRFILDVIQHFIAAPADGLKPSSGAAARQEAALEAAAGAAPPSGEGRQL